MTRDGVDQDYKEITRYLIENTEKRDFLFSWPLKAYPIIWGCILLIIGLAFSDKLREEMLSFFSVCGFNVVIGAIFLRYSSLYKKFILGIAQIDLRYWVLWFFLAYCAMSAFENTFPRRLAFMTFSPYILLIFGSFFVEWTAEKVWREKLALMIAMGSILAFIVPGWYLPPFYGGIDGWISQVNYSKPLRLHGAQTR